MSTKDVTTKLGLRRLLTVSARKRDGEGAGTNWGDCEFKAKSFETAFKTAAKKLRLRGRILSIEQVGSEQWAVNVDGTMMMVIIHE